MADPEVMIEFIRQVCHVGIPGVCAGHHQVGGQCRVGLTHTPDM